MATESETSVSHQSPIGPGAALIMPIYALATLHHYTALHMTALLSSTLHNTALLSTTLHDTAMHITLLH